MKKVEIKRVKRNKKVLTASEKIMAGLGVGSALFGGAAGTAAAASNQQTQFVRTMPSAQNASRTAAREKIKAIFGDNPGAAQTADSQNTGDLTIDAANPAADAANNIQSVGPPLLTLDQTSATDQASNQATDNQTVVDLSATSADDNSTDVETADTAAVVSPVSISAPSLTNATVGAAYSSPQFSASGGTGPYSWSLAAGSALPGGLNLDPASGTISGTPATAGTYSFSIQATDASGNTASSPSLTLNVGAAVNQLLTLNSDPSSDLTLNNLNTANTNVNTLSVSSPSLALAAGASATITVSSGAGALDAPDMQVTASSGNALAIIGSGGVITVIGNSPGLSVLSIAAMGQTLTVPVTVSAAPVITTLGSATNLLSLDPVSGSLQMPSSPVSSAVSQNQAANQLLSVTQTSSSQGTGTTAVHTVQGGDTLWGIAQKYYGDGSQWRKILSANPSALSSPGNTRTLKIGAQLTIPSLN